MRHRKFTFKIGRSSAHVRSLLANAVCSLIKHRRITTTLVRAKRIRMLADQMVTLGKDGSLHARRLAIAKLHQPDTVAILFDQIAPGFKERKGGYTRIMKLGPRRGDAAEMAIIEFVEADDVVAARANAQPETATEPPAEEAKTETVEIPKEETVEVQE
ncbi:MAG: 50S ribosomal protein L17 [Lentisphaerae bacterium]|jgi:large subunit ribosomal protein L17|nr:50S ribosomal protein L17 [Lentisphaerota bacterium]